MPTVPRYGGGVASTAVNTPRENPNANHDAFGVQGPNVLEGAVPNLIQMVQVHKQKADQVANLASDNELAALESRLLYDSKSGALNKRGKDAFDLPETVGEEWRKGVSEIEAKLGNKEQRLAFANSRAQREVNIHTAVQKHVSDQLKSYDDQETQSFLTNERSATLANYQDSQRVELGIDRQRAALTDYAKRNGMSPEKLKDLQQNATSQTYAGVLDRMLTNDQDLTATKYYKDVKEYMTGEDQGKIEKALEEGSLRGESQRQADVIVSKFGKDWDKAQAAVVAIQDPKIRDAVKVRVNQNFAEQRQIDQQKQEDLYLRATNMIDADPNRNARDVVPAPIWAQLNLGMRNALENRGGDVTNDDQKWLNFLEKSPQEVANLNKVQFESQYWAHLDKQHRARAETLWNAAKDAMSNKEAQPNLHLATTLSFKDRLLNTAGKAGVVKPNETPAKFSRTEAKNYAGMEQEAAKQVELFERTQLQGKRPATGEEMQTIIDKVVLNRVFIDKPHSVDVKKLGWEVSADEQGKAYIPLDSIPAVELTPLRNAITSRGSKITSRKLERLYAAVLMNNRTLYESILEEK